MTNRRLLTFALTVVGLAVSASLGQANIIGPGGSNLPDVLTVGPTATLVDIHTGTISTSSLTLPYTEYVFSDPTNNIFCSGCLDFLVMISNASPSDTVSRVTLSPFAAVSTDVGVNVTGAPGVLPVVGVAPGTVDRSVNANVVGFNYAVGLFKPGTSSVLLEIQTNGTQDVAGLLGAIDGDPGSGPGFGAAPEPNLVGLLFGGSLALIGLARRFKMIG